MSGERCGLDGVDGGLFARERLGAGPNPSASSYAYFTFTAPSATSISALNYRRFFERFNDDGSWRQELRTSTGVLEACNTAPDCALGASGGAAAGFTALSTAYLRFGIWCQPISPASACDNGATLQSAHVVMFSSTVTIEDPTPPTGVALESPPNAWTAGPVSLAVTAKDSAGIASRSITIDGQERGRTAATCDYTRPAPCPDTSTAGNASVALDLGGVSDGMHTVRGVATDPGANSTSSAPQTLKLDRSAQATGGIERVGERWSTAARRTVRVAIPAQANAPIDAVLSQRCDADGSNCDAITTTPVAASATTADVTVDAPADGDYVVRAWLRDEAGNADPALAGEAPVGVDHVAPTASVVLSRSGALLEGTQILVDSQVLDPAPGSGVSERSVEMSVDGGPFTPAPADFIVKAGSTYALRGVAIDRAGNRGESPVVTATGIARPTGPSPIGPTPGTLGTAPFRIAAGLKLLSARRIDRRSVRVVASTGPAADGAKATALLTLTTASGRKLRVTRSATVRRGRVSMTLVLPRALRSRSIPRTRRVVVTLAPTDRTLAARATLPVARR